MVTEVIIEGFQIAAVNTRENILKGEKPADLPVITVHQIRVRDQS